MGRKIKAFDPFHPNPNKLKQYNALLDRTKDGRPRNDPVKPAHINRTSKSFQWFQTSVQLAKLQEKEQKEKQLQQQHKKRKLNQSTPAATVTTDSTPPTSHTTPPSTTAPPVSAQVQRLQSALQRKTELRKKHKQQHTLPTLEQQPGETFHAYTRRVRQRRDAVLLAERQRSRQGGGGDGGVVDGAVAGSIVDQKRIQKHHDKLLRKRERKTQSASNSKGGIDAAQSTALSKRERHGERLKKAVDSGDRPKFGEVVHRPPTLTVKPKLKAKRTPQAGNDSDDEREKQRKALSERQIAIERERAIQVYKAMKAKGEKRKAAEGDDS